MPEIYLALSRHEVKVGSTITVQVSGLLPPLPYEIWVNDTQWYVSPANYSEQIRHHDFHADEVGIFDFYALMYYPLEEPPSIIYSNHETLAVLTYDPNGDNNDGQLQQNTLFMAALFIFIVMLIALWRKK